MEEDCSVPSLWETLFVTGSGSSLVGLCSRAISRRAISAEGLLACGLSEAIGWLTMPSLTGCANLCQAWPSSLWLHILTRVMPSEAMIGVHGAGSQLLWSGQRCGLHGLWTISAPGSRSECRPSAFPTSVPVLKRTNTLYRVLFQKTGVRPWPGSPLNTAPHGRKDRQA